MVYRDAEKISLVRKKKVWEPKQAVTDHRECSANFTDSSLVVSLPIKVVWDGTVTSLDMLKARIKALSLLLEGRLVIVMHLQNTSMWYCY